MSLTVGTDLVKATTSDQLSKLRELFDNRLLDREVEIDTSKLDSEALNDLLDAANIVRDAKTARAIESIAQARAGVFDKPVPNFKAFKAVVEAFLKVDHIDGWIYVTADDAKLYPQLVTEVRYDDGMSYKSGTASVRIHTICYGFSKDGKHNKSCGVYQTAHTFYPRDVSKRRIADILSAIGIFKETHALRNAHLLSVQRHKSVTQDAFAKQFRITGGVYQFKEDHYAKKGIKLSDRRVIHDLKAMDCGPMQPHAESFIFEDNAGAEGVGMVPEHPVVKVFDLRTHEFFWVNADNLTPYEYDKSLRDKLILPPTHRDLLDVLTMNLGAFVNDFIEGKSAGNVILCKGIPGVGKTLTAEVYAELIERPLYAIHSGSLGTDAATIEKNLKRIFLEGQRWDCVLLLDEADVFVVSRGTNIEQNAIVAEFLRTLEYFDGLLFMTTNRPDDIDEAIISRCAAIIDYAPPEPKDAAAIWRVMATQYQSPLSDELISQLVELFPLIAPRDIKMIFRLALRVSGAHNEPLTIDTFRRCAMFRAIKMVDAS